MARYIGPKRKIERRFGENIFNGKDINKKKYPPGEHGISSRRRKKSEYAIQLSEKQKVKYIYGILERQFLKMFKEASRKKGVTGELLLQMCESRLDNIVFRLKLANSRAEARQIVLHRHIKINGKIINIPSYQVYPMDIISVKDKSKKHPAINQSLNNRIDVICDWLTWDANKMEGTFQSIPDREKIPENIKEQLIVELYSK